MGGCIFWFTLCETTPKLCQIFTSLSLPLRKPNPKEKKKKKKKKEKEKARVVGYFWRNTKARKSLIQSLEPISKLKGNLLKLLSYPFKF